jgi:hypothetical protein
MPITQVRTNAASAAKSHSGPSAADLKTAAKLKTSVLDVLKLVRFGQPLAAADQPKVNAKNEWRAPNGDRLISVTLSTPPKGTADGMSHAAFVNPKTNEFYEGTFGGFAGLRQFHGPLALPAGTKFTGKTFTAKDIDALTAAANGKTTSTTTATAPTKTTMLNALGTYEFHKLLKYGAKGPGPSDVLKSVLLKKENHPDGFSYTGLVLKSNPNKVVIQRSGGFAGITTYSQPIDVTRLPK